jgi:hypothetical protein
MILKRWVEHFDVYELQLQESTIVDGTQEDTEPAATTEETEVTINLLKPNGTYMYHLLQQ